MFDINYSKIMMFLLDILISLYAVSPHRKSTRCVKGSFVSSQDAKLLKPHSLREPDRISYVLVVDWKQPFEKKPNRPDPFGHILGHGPWDADLRGDSFFS